MAAAAVNALAVPAVLVNVTALLPSKLAAQVTPLAVKLFASVTLLTLTNLSAS